MFRKIKKLYFKIYHLFKLIGVFLLIFSFTPLVKADTCTNLLENKIIEHSEYTYASYHAITITYKNISVNASSDKTFSIINNDTSIYNYLSNLGITSGFLNFCYDSTCASRGSAISSYTDNFKVVNYSFNFSPRDVSIRYDIPNGIYTSNIITTLESIPWYLNEGSTICSPSPPPSDSPLSSFIDIFVDRFTYLSSGIFTNAYIFAFIVIIFTFCILELFFKLIHLQRRRKK